MEEKFLSTAATNLETNETFFFDKENGRIPFSTSRDLSPILPIMRACDYLASKQFEGSRKRSQANSVKKLEGGTHKVSERRERSFWKTSILAMNPAKWLQTQYNGTSTTMLTHSFRLTRSFRSQKCASLRSAQQIRGLPEDFQKEHPNVKLEESLLVHMKYRMNPKVGRFVTLGNLSQLKIPKSVQLIMLEKKRAREKEINEKTTGLIVHEMSKYFGNRVHTGKTDDMFIFALFSEIFTGHYHRIGDKVDGLEAFLNKQFEAIMLTKLNKMMINVGDIYTNGTWHYPHSEVLKYAKDISNSFNGMKESCKIITEAVNFGRADKMAYRSLVHRLQVSSNSNTHPANLN